MISTVEYFIPVSTGNFGFIAVEGWMDCREATIDDRPVLEFS